MAPLIEDQPEEIRKPSGLRISSIMFIVFLLALVFSIARFSWVVLVCILAPLIGVAGVAPIVLGARKKARNLDGLIDVLALASGNDMPLSPGLRAYSELVEGGFKSKVALLAERMDSGEPLPAALRSIKGVVRPADLLSIDFSWNDHKLSSALQKSAEKKKRLKKLVLGLGGRIGYFFCLLAAVEAFVIFEHMKVQASILKIITEMKTAPPAITASLVVAEKMVVESAFIFVLPVVQIALFYLFITKLFGFWTWGFPLVDRLFLRADSFRILESIALATESGRTIPDALAKLSAVYPKKWVRKRLSAALELIRGGANWSSALASRFLISSNDKALLQASEEAGNLPWALHSLVEQGERRWRERLEIGSQLVSLLTLLVFGLIVFYLAVAYYAPLVVIIDKLSQL